MLYVLYLCILTSMRIARYDLGRQTPTFSGGSITVGIRARFKIKHTQKHLKIAIMLSVRNA
jgi:hypothetical protein